MSDNLKYYYIKVKENYYDSDEMILLESMQDGYLYTNILMKLHLRSLKNGGKLMLNDKIPYNDIMLASVTRHSVGNIKQALQIFQRLGLIEVLKNGAIYMNDIQNLIGKSSTEADRKRNYRAKIEKEKKSLSSSGKRKKPTSKDKEGQMSDKNPPKIELELIEIENDTEKYEKLNQYLFNMQVNRDKEKERLENLASEKKEIEF